MNEAVLRADNISRHFVDGASTLPVLTGVSFELRAGEVTALVGRSGCGKSTLLHILGLLDRPDSGEVLIEGTPAGRLSVTRSCAAMARAISSGDSVDRIDRATRAPTPCTVVRMRNQSRSAVSRKP